MQFSTLRLLGSKPLTLVICFLLAQALLVPAAEAFELTRERNQKVKIKRDEITQDGVILSRGRQQTYGNGPASVDLASFGDVHDLGISAITPSTMAATEESGRFLRIRLSGAERAQCLNHADFDVSFAVTGPTANALTSIQAGGGTLQVQSFETTTQGASRGRCPRDLFYGYNLSLGLDVAIADNDYRGDLEVTVTGPGGITQNLQTALVVDMPNILILYHYDEIDINVQASALGELIAPGSQPCSSGQCAALGIKSLTLASLQLPVDADISGSAPSVTALIPNVILENVVAARAVGCGSGIYAEASFEVFNTSGGILPGTGIINDIQGLSCGFNLQLGDVEFDLDLNAATFNGPGAEATAEIRITITGL